MTKKIVVLIMVIALMFVPTIQANAETSNSSEKLNYHDVQERVFNEVKDGYITNTSDVIMVAVQQYNERLSKKRSLYQKNSQPQDDSLSITQVLNTYEENGELVENILTTNLLVLDKNQNLVTASSIVSGSGQISEYSVYASMNVSVTNNTSSQTVCFNYFDTILYYGTALKAGSLTQASSYAPETYFQYDDKTIQISNPQGNVSYRYIPLNTQMVSYLTMGCGRACRSIISVGTKSLTLAYSITNSNPSGLWETSY